MEKGNNFVVVVRTVLGEKEIKTAKGDPFLPTVWDEMPPMTPPLASNSLCGSFSIPQVNFPNTVIIFNIRFADNPWTMFCQQQPGKVIHRKDRKANGRGEEFHHGENIFGEEESNGKLHPF